MPRSPGLWLEEIITAGTEIRGFLEDASFDEYARNSMMSAAVERKLLIVGEAVARLHDEFPSVAENLGPVRAIVGFRNALVHGYFKIDEERVFRTATTDLPVLLEKAVALLAENSDIDD